MFGIEKLREQIAGLSGNIHQLFDRVHSHNAAIAKLNKTVSGLESPVTAQRADELAVAISKCSLDMAELDRRLCALENAQTFTMDYEHYNTILTNGNSAALSERDKAFSPNAVLVPKAAQQRLPLTRKRNTAVGVAEDIIANDVDAANLYRIAVARAYNGRLIRKALACGIIEANRNGKQLRLRVSSNGKAHPYNVFIEDYYSNNGSTERHVSCDSESEQNNFYYQLQAWQYEIQRYFKSQVFAKVKL